MMDQSVELRMGSVKVTRVRSATEVQFGPDVAKTSGIWLVVDVDFTPKDEPHSLLTPQLSDSQGRDFGDFQAITVPPCGPGTAWLSRSFMKAPYRTGHRVVISDSI